MNKDNAHLYLPLVQALAEGKTIEHSCDGNYWEKLSSTVDFLFDPEQYRIVQEPRKPAELLVWVKEDGTPTMRVIGFKEGETFHDETVRLFREVTNQ
jgi:hypothetical protein